MAGDYFETILAETPPLLPRVLETGPFSIQGFMTEFEGNVRGYKSRTQMELKQS
jgi:hypothetical protein